MLDVLVIGSGAGGLTAALALARAGKKVHVVEQHTVPGGYCHSFTLERHRFSPGVHYLGDLGPGGFLRRILEGLDVTAEVSFFELNRDGYDHMRTGDPREDFDYPAGRAALEERLATRFPRDARGIHRYLDAVQRIGEDMRVFARNFGWTDYLAAPWRIPTTVFKGYSSTASLLAKYIDDPLCRHVLGLQAGDHGVPPSRSPFLFHGVTCAHYLEGAYYPRGGGAGLVKGFTRGLRKAGGSIAVEASVERILVEREGGKPRAIGVRMRDGTELRAQHVVSNADPVVTYGLVEDDFVPRALKERLGKTRWSVSTVGLFLAVEQDLRALGLDSGNYWLMNGPDPERFFVSAEELVAGGPLPLFVSVSTLKEPTHYDGRHHLVEAFAFVDAAPFAKWESVPHDQRDALGAWKTALEQRILQRLDALIPGVATSATFRSLSTPLTNEHFVAATHGSVYGTEKIGKQVGPWAFQPRTHVENLWLCGASTFGMGVIGATVSGLRVAGELLDCPIEALMRTGGTPLSSVLADDPSSWTEEMHRDIAERAARERKRH